MTNHNPAASQPSSPQDRSRQRDILAKVNAHADRSLDRVFADIDELLGDDLATNTHSLSVQQPQRPQYATDSAYTDQYSPRQPQLQAQAPARSYPPQPIAEPTPAAGSPKPNIPLWLKILLGIGVTSIAIGSTLVWLVNERKIELPKDASWLPFQSQSQSAVEDAKFARYMQKSLAKIDANPQAAAVTTPTAPAPSIAAPVPSAAVTAPTTTGAIAVTATPVAVTTPIGLIKTLPNNQQPGAVFEIDRRTVVVNVGQKIGTSNWSLVTVNKGEVMVKRKGGEIRSIEVGQKF